ncbi:Hint domain-containing protein [Alphaproteobacteria bacterium KMM 3653]|uniref:Hint domain-containing protein n=1 Tax=Harenicola maris TaxID=2841044 RepID=A0AAP2CQ67_9RHOB|nr:Hint domain-containing protein [Harenicola maris]
MPTTYTDQFFDIDPFSPPSAGTAMNFSNYDLVDADDDNDIGAAGADTVNGIDVTNAYPGDTVTINVPGVGNVTYEGITFYLSNGDRVFTPTDGQALQNGTLVSTTWVSTTGDLDVGDLGPPCFTPGTLIDTPKGARAIEDLCVGDLVMTADHGPQPIRWIGRREVEGSGDFAPIRIAKGALGNRRDLLVSPQHRMLISGWQAELLYGQEEVLIAAVHLLGHDRIHRAARRSVTYMHLMFDAHEVIFAEGVASESFDPGGHQGQEICATHEELRALFPEVAGRAPSLTAREVIRGRSAAALFA